MRKKGFSQITLTVIESIWFFFSVIITLNISDIYHLSLWIELCIGTLLLIIGQNLIRKFIKISK